MLDLPHRAPSAPTAAGWRDVTIGADGADPLRVRVHGTAGVAKAVVLHFHGGAFVGGDLDAAAHVAGALTGAGAVVVSVDYPLAPARPFPHAIDAGWRALAWVDRERRRLAAARTPIHVAGEDAGATIAAGLAMMARDRGGPAIAGQMLLSPMLDPGVGTRSQRDARAGEAGCPCASGWRAYLAGADPMHPYAAPGASLRLGGLPPTLLVTAEDDPQRDETRAWAARLAASGVAVRVHVVPAPTGWPAGYRRPLPESCAAALRTPLQAFLDRR